MSIHVSANCGGVRKSFDFLFHALGAVRVVGFNGDAVERIAEPVKFLTDVKRHEQEF